jgi:O-antigen/teichoic acid export membrane protein
MTNLKDIISPFGKSGNIYLFGAISQGLAPVFLTPFLTRSISPIEFGQVSVLNSIALIISIIFSFGIPIVISRSYILEKDQARNINQLVNKVTTTYLLLSLFLYLVYKFIEVKYVLFLSIGLIFAIYQIVLPTLRARDEAFKFALYSIINTLFPSLTILIIFIFYSNIYDLFFLGALVSGIIGKILSHKKTKHKLIFKYIKDTIKLSLPILPHMLGMVALINIDKVLFGELKSESSAGYIQIIMLVGLSPIFILSALNHAWLNQILEQLKKVNSKVFKEINTTIRNLFILCTLIIIVLFIFGEKILFFLNPNIVINENVIKTLQLALMTSFLYIIYLANTHLLTWNKQFWILGVTTPITILAQSLIIYFYIDELNYLSASVAFGLALLLQIIFLEIFNNFNSLNKIIDLKIKLISILIFCFFSFYFIIETII